MLRAALLFFFAALPLKAQAPDATFRATTTLVQTTAVVRDRQGKPVGGLTAADFELFADDKRQTIAYFAVEKLDSGEGPPKASDARSRRTAVAFTPPNRFVAFVLDDANLVPEHFPLAMLAAIRHVDELRAGDRAAVLSSSGNLTVGFTDDRDQLRRALASAGSLDRRETFDVSPLNSAILCRITYLKADWIRNGDAASLRNCVPSALTPAPLRLDRPAGLAIPSARSAEGTQIATENQVRAFAESIVQAGDRDVRNYFGGLLKLIDTMSRLPGERSILLLSPGLYVAPRFQKLQDEIVTAAVRAHVVINAVDPRGAYLRDDVADPSTWSDAWGLAETKTRNAVMEDLTAGTGGAFIRGDNDVAGALRRLDSAPEFLYVLGFSPAGVAGDGKYHPLRVSVAHHREFTVMARRGYYTAGAAAEEDTRAARDIGDIFFSGRQRYDLPLRVTLRSSQKPNAKTVLTATVHGDLSKAPFRAEDSVQRLDLALVVGLFDRNGVFLKDVQQEIGLHPANDRIEAVRRAGIDLTAEFEVDAGRYFLRVLLRENQGQTMGLQTVSVEIEP